MENMIEKADTYRILADGKFMNNNTWKTNLNNNDLIIGPSGSGKTRNYVIPNILQCNESMVICDTKNAIYSQVKPILEQKGYKVIKINLADCAKSPCGYNPLKYIRRDRGRYSQQDILVLSAALCPIENDEIFWDYSSRLCLEALVSYVLESLPIYQHNLSSVVRLAGELGKNGKYRKLMSELEVIDPDSFALSRYRMFKSVSEDCDRTFSCIISFIMSKISPFAFDGANKLFTNPETINIKELGRQKTAVFLTISDTDTSMCRLANIFYTQALHTLCDLADKLPGHRLPVPVRFFLDDFGAASTVIPDFDKIISVIRSREISVSVIIQSLSQLESRYDRPKAMTIINNCDNLLCLGSGRDIETARYISHQVNKPVSAILNTPLDDAWLLTRGRKGEQVTKYQLKNHRYYDALPEAKQLKKPVKQPQPENCI